MNSFKQTTVVAPYNATLFHQTIKRLAVAYHTSSNNLTIVSQSHTLSLTDTTVVNAYFGHFDIFIPMESCLHHTSNDAINFVVF